MCKIQLYNLHPGQRIEITEAHLDEIRKAEATIGSTSYYEPRVTWDTKRNTQMQLLAISAMPKQWVADKYRENLDVHVSLLRQVYIEDIDDSSADETGMAYKKPFGNSDVTGDVIEAMRELGFRDPESEEDDTDYTEVEEAAAQKMLNEFAHFIADFFADGFEPTTLVFIGSERYTMNKENFKAWRMLGVNPEHYFHQVMAPDPMEVRNEKLKRLGI